MGSPNRAKLTPYPANAVGFIDLDMVLDPEVVVEAVAAIGSGAGPVIVPERTVGEGFWTRVRAFERAFYDGADGIEAARFYRADVFAQTGGFDEAMTGPEDIDLTIEARRIAPVVRIHARIDHDEGRLGYLEACRKKAYYAEGIRRYVAKRGAAALPSAFDRPWLRRPTAMLSPLGAGLLALKAGEATAVALALTTHAVGPRGRCRPRWRGAQVQSDVHAGFGHRASDPGAACDPAPGIVLHQRLRRVWHGVRWSTRIVRTMRHSVATLARMAVGIVRPEQAGDVTFVTRQGVQCTAPAREDHWWPVLEVLVDDCYRLRQVLGELPARPQVVDVGAHVGSFTLAVAAGLPASRVTAFEPSTERAGYLRRNVAANGLQDRVAVVQAAVGDRRATRVLVGSAIDDRGSTADGELVEVAAFDEVIEAVDGQVDLLKLDCEGGEYDIVGSAPDATLRRIDRILVEYHPAPAAEVDRLFERLASAGFVVRWREDAVPGQLGTVYFDRVGS